MCQSENLSNLQSINNSVVTSFYKYTKAKDMHTLNSPTLSYIKHKCVHLCIKICTRMLRAKDL